MNSETSERRRSGTPTTFSASTVVGHAPEQYTNEQALAESTLDHAIGYAKLDLKLLPVHGVTSDGACTCGRRDCALVGKHPNGLLTPHWKESSTSDVATIKNWLDRFKSSNIAIVCGNDSAVVCLDCDRKPDGPDGVAALAALEKEHGELPETWVSCSGGGGRHFWFRYPPGLSITNRTGSLPPGIDVRGEGGYVLAPPSQHAGGERYAWFPGLEPASVALAPLPNWLVRLLLAPPSIQSVRSIGAIPEGSRNSTLASLAGTMRRRGFSVEAIEAALQAENQIACRPPLNEEEVSRIAVSIGKYPTGDSSVAFAPSDGSLHTLRPGGITRTKPGLPFSPMEFRDGKVVIK